MDHVGNANDTGRSNSVEAVDGADDAKTGDGAADDVEGSDGSSVG